MTGPKAILGKLFKMTKNGSATLDKNLDHQRIIAISTPNIAPKPNPMIVSKHVTPRCVNKSFCDKLKKVFTIRLGLLAIKLSIIPISAM